MFPIGLILYILASKSCCKSLSTNFRITIALASTIGINVIFLTILYANEVSANDTVPAVSGGTLIEQVFSLILFSSSSRVRNSMKRKISIIKKKTSTTSLISKNLIKGHKVDGVYKELQVPLVEVS